VEHFGGACLVFLFQDLLQTVKTNALHLLSSICSHADQPPVCRHCVNHRL
jgi:hypothetical protein